MFLNDVSLVLMVQANHLSDALANVTKVADGFFEGRGWTMDKLSVAPNPDEGGFLVSAKIALVPRPVSVPPSQSQPGLEDEDTASDTAQTPQSPVAVPRPCSHPGAIRVEAMGGGASYVCPTCGPLADLF